MRKKRYISVLMFLFLGMFVLSTTVHAEVPNVKDCLDGSADCPELGETNDAEMELNDEAQTKGTNSQSIVFDLIKMVFALLLVLALIYFLLKFLNKRSKLYQQVKALENMGGISVGQNKSIQIVRIGSKLYVIGVGENVELLQEITDETLKQELFTNDQTDESKPTAMFNNLFNQKSNKGSSKKFNQLFSNELDKLKKTRKEIIDQQKKKEDEHDGIY
ncbi:flagellar biosynthetic protein FliO [Virgibacillus sp. W0181]|uniref:flagellar biosynthetic protein FliO n=1 Tax=Virgibacillus sp. W0181 TaxID=3391581 RepID=UPI003F47A8B8